MRRLSLLLPLLFLAACSADLTPGEDVARVPFDRTGTMVNTDNEWYLEYDEDGTPVSKILSMTSTTLCTVNGVPEPCIAVTPQQGQSVRVVGELLSAESKVVQAATVELR